MTDYKSGIRINTVTYVLWDYCEVHIVKICLSRQSLCRNCNWFTKESTVKCTKYK